MLKAKGDTSIENWSDPLQFSLIVDTNLKDVCELADELKGQSLDVSFSNVQLSLCDIPEMRAAQILSQGGPLCKALQKGCEAVSMSLKDMWIILDVAKTSYEHYTVPDLSLRSPTGAEITNRDQIIDRFIRVVADECANGRDELPISLDDLARILCAVTISPTRTWSGQVTASSPRGGLFSESFEITEGNSPYGYQGAGTTLFQVGNLITHLTRSNVSIESIVKVVEESLRSIPSSQTLDELKGEEARGLKEVPISPQPFGREYAKYAKSQNRSPMKNTSKELIATLIACGVSDEIAETAILMTTLGKNFMFGLEQSCKSAGIFHSNE